jgi:hypothetical protein
MNHGANHEIITTSLRLLAYFRLARILHVNSGKNIQPRPGRAMHRFMGGALKIACTAIFITAGLCFMRPAFANLLGVDQSTGELYSISETTAAISPIGNTGISGATGAWADIQRAPNGTLYGFTTSAATPTLYSINPATAAVTAIGPLNAGAFVYEGGLAFAPNGTAYAMNRGSPTSDTLFTINTSTGAATSKGLVTGAANLDINGLAYRSDGKLIGLDDNSNSLVVIDPTTLVLTTLAAVPTNVGAVGGMTVENGVGYYVTGGPAATTPCSLPPCTPGSDKLYSFDLFSGNSTPIGGDLGFTDFGLSGLAAVPVPVPTPSAPATFGILVAALAILELAHRRHRTRSVLRRPPIDDLA